MAEVNDFLNPRSMLTPGIAGGITMTIANTLWVQFGLESKWTALVISFALSLLVFRAQNIPFWEKIIYYGLNALIIYSVGVGAQKAVTHL